MKRMLLAAMMVLTVMALAGCGDGTTTVVTQPPTFTAQIPSEPAFDGDIENDAGLFTVTRVIPQGVQSVFAGIHPASGAVFRAFLDFSLASVPLDAVIKSALLTIRIDSIQPLIGTIPIRIELVSFQPSTLQASDFDRPGVAITPIIIPIIQTDFGKDVSIDVTSFMKEAQFEHLTNFQIRIMEDLGIVSPGLIEINDTTGANRGLVAPQLEVTYF